MKQERITNPSSVERAVIESKIAEGYLVILQFDKPPYSLELLKRINNLCGEFGEKLEVRFYGHYGTHFDASVLRSLPDVAALSIDCLLDVTNLAALNELANLRCLSLGIYNLDDPQILQSLQLQNLETLSIGESLEVNFDLAPLQASYNLARLYVEKHTKNIESLATLPALRDLTLRCISKKQSIGFVSKIQALKRLVVILGGRTNISEIQHPKLEELEILRVMGFDNLDPPLASAELASAAQGFEQAITALPKIAQPFMAGLSVTQNEKSRRDGRMVLSSLTGLGNWGGRKPTAKAVGYFQN